MPYNKKSETNCILTLIRYIKVPNKTAKIIFQSPVMQELTFFSYLIFIRNWNRNQVRFDSFLPILRNAFCHSFKTFLLMVFKVKWIANTLRDGLYGNKRISSLYFILHRAKIIWRYPIKRKLQGIKTSRFIKIAR